MAQKELFDIKKKKCWIEWLWGVAAYDNVDISNTIAAYKASHKNKEINKYKWITYILMNVATADKWIQFS